MAHAILTLVAEIIRELCFGAIAGFMVVRYLLREELSTATTNHDTSVALRAAMTAVEQRVDTLMDTDYFAQLARTAPPPTRPSDVQ